MNKKIGLISYHRDPNYGTMLQAFALAYSIKKLGEDCEYLNYYEYKRPSVIKRIISKYYRLIKRLLNLRSQGEYDYFNSTEFATIKDSFDEFHKKYIYERFFEGLIHKTFMLFMSCKKLYIRQRFDASG